MDELTNKLANLETEDVSSRDNSVHSTPSKTVPTPSPIPGPPGLPILGNLTDLDPEVPLTTFMRLADTYGPVFSLQLGGGPKRVFINSVELLEEVCDEKRFGKIVTGALEQLRSGVGAGLFTAHTDEKEWGIAHRILMPAFGPLAIREMFDDMHDIASQMVMKWARYGPEHRILATDDFTRLTLDTLSLCTMGYRFNSFYTSDMHPFVDAMVDYLVESGRRANRPKLASFLMRGTNQKYAADVKLMRDVASGVVKTRRENPTQKKDLLNAMINGRDPKTGEGLEDELIYSQMITFLIAGHETTSGLLSFVFCNLLQHSSAYRAAQKEVDDVCGKGPITADHLPKLKYISAVLRETLRLNPTAPLFSTTLNSNQDQDSATLGNGRYALEKGQAIIAVLPNIHRDPKVYGEDADVFKPERMLDEEFEKLPAAAWKPFGNGMRGCIGRPFAWQESLLVVALLLQHFNFALDDPNYKLQLKQTLTIKPKDFYMRATLRDGIDATKLERTMAGSSATATTEGIAKPGEEKAAAAAADKDKPARKPMSIFYGSNTGTCEALAQRLSTSAASHGFDAAIATMDSANGKLPKDRPVVFITASYEGQPPDNATHFMEWLQSLTGDEAAGTSFAVFGCGHRDWRSTYQRIPTLVDELLLARGATRVTPKGEADASQGDIFTEFDNWEDAQLWPTVTERFGGKPVATDEATTSTVLVEISFKKRSSNLRMDVREARVTAAHCLTAPGEPEKRHLEIELPSDMPYRAGDYLAILPVNPRETINRVMKRFQLPWDAHLHISSTAPTVLPTDSEISAHDILATYVELSQPATKKNVLALAAAADSDQPSIKASLEALASTSFHAEITLKRTSPLDLLERYPTLLFPLGDFLSMLPPMRMRQYSISSSPLTNPSQCTLTYSVLDAASSSSPPHRHIGVATTYLSTLSPGNVLQVSVRSSAHSFHLPLNLATTPIVMVCAGSGLAPFRGFVQERATQLAAGRQLARALLFVGCRYHDRDRLYADELKEWEKAGAIEVHYAFSREPELAEGCKYVQDRMRKDVDMLMETWDAGAKVFVCGGARVGEEVSKVCKEAYRERMRGKGEEKTEDQAEEWFAALRNERFATDVFD